MLKVIKVSPFDYLIVHKIDRLRPPLAPQPRR